MNTTGACGNQSEVMTSAGYSKVHLSKDKTANFCRRHRIRKLVVFDAVLHGDVEPDSDLDVLSDSLFSCQHHKRPQRFRPRWILPMRLLS